MDTKTNIVNALIDGTTLSNDDHGLLSAFIYLDYGDGSHQGFGGYSLYLPKSFKHHQLQSIAGHFIFRTLEVAGVTKWENLKGRTIRVRKSGFGFGTTIEAIGHIINDDWFCPSEDFKDIV